MILVSIGNLGDLLIQAAFLRKLDRPGVSLAVPQSYRAIASELFPQAVVIGMDDSLSDGRVLAAAQIDRATAVASIIGRLEREHPGASVKSIALTDDLILQRSLNIYEAYWQLLSRDADLARELSPARYPSAIESWQPFAHLSRWDRARASRTIVFCPWGGIGVKNIPPADLGRMRRAAVRAGYAARLIASSRDNVTAYDSFSPTEIVRLPDETMIRDAVAQFSSAALVVAVDTAWYHLAAMIGAPVLGIPGPRSLKHFEFPARKEAGTVVLEQRDCVDCFSVDRCALNNRPVCEAKPGVEKICDALLSNVGARRSFWQKAFSRY